MSKYFIRGTIKIHKTSSDLKISITPATGFLSPEVKQRAIAFPIDAAQDSAKLIGLVEKELLIELDSKLNDLPTLTTIAAQQKCVELILKGEVPPNKFESTIVGFIFPTK
jgi:hypothetical protein